MEDGSHPLGNGLDEGRFLAADPLAGFEFRQVEHIVEQLLQEARDTQGASSFIIESIRTEGEVTALRALAPDSSKLFAVDADAKLRYTRVHERGTATDHVTLDEFLANEAREMHATDPTKQNLARCIEIADAKFMNDGSLEQLWEQVQAALPAIVPGPSA